jgi:hypothetical protein
MATSSIALRFCILCILPTSLAAQKKAGEPVNPQVVAIQTVISEVKTALGDVQTTLKDNSLPPLKSITLNLQAVADKNGGPSVKLWVFSFGHKWEKEKSQEITIELGAPPAGAPRKAGTQTLTQAFEDAIISAAQGVEAARKEGGVALELKSLSVELSFTVKNSNSAKGTIEIAPITLDLDADWSKTAIQKIQIVFSS